MPNSLPPPKAKVMVSSLLVCLFACYLPKFFVKYVRLSVCPLVCPLCQAQLTNALTYDTKIGPRVY